MADPKGFMKYTRELPETREVSERVNDYKDLYKDFPKEKTVTQAARCMDCGVPFCHNGCPLGNIIPEFNEAVHEGDWEAAFRILSATNNFPEFTGRICPAPCEAACVLGINSPPVAIEHIEKTIADVAFEKGYLRPEPPVGRTGKRVAVVGSGPAGLAAADQLNKAGHSVEVLERNDRIGGLLRYGIPDFKLEKHIVERRVHLMEAEGIRFRINAHVGENVTVSELLNNFDAVVLCAGSTVPRDLPLEGRDLNGIYFAMDFLEQNNRKVAGDKISEKESVTAEGKHVIVIGGGDTGADCVGTSNRQKAASVTQIELLEKPPEERDPLNWPNWPMVLRTSTSHEEGCERAWAVMTERFIGDEYGNLKAIETTNLEWKKNPETGMRELTKIPGSEKQLPCDLLLIAAGFLHPEKGGMLDQLGVETDARGNVKTENYRTAAEKVFAAGDMRRGQSLVVWAINEGREA
ncbi:MAG: glutamate synthase subunit beta, partial [Flavobacteriales bacterium]|nr:glutamate synthase subunit beta [Flavobacteriales bacterium]